MGRREYAQVLRLLETFELADEHAALKKALKLGAVSFDADEHLVLCDVERRPPKLDLDVYPYLPRANVGTTSAASYMALPSGDAAWPIGNWAGQTLLAVQVVERHAKLTPI